MENNNVSCQLISKYILHITTADQTVYMVLWYA